MDRRAFLATSGMGALALAATGEAARADEPRRFESVQDFTGKWAGNYDGRNARMSISVKPHEGDSESVDVTILFEEVDRDQRSGNEGKDHVHVEKPGATPHILHDVKLTPVDGEGETHLKRLFLHTWNVDYLSGVSLWNETEYGFSFRREA